MEFLYSFFIGRQHLLDITNSILNKDKILKVVGAITIAHQTAKYMGWNKHYAFYLLRQIPYIKETIYNKKMEIRKTIKEDLNKPIEHLTLNLKLPEKGLSKKDILSQVQEYEAIMPYDSNKGRVSGCVYSNSIKLDNLMYDIYPMFERTNPLHPDIYPGVRKMEAEIVNMCGNLMKSVHPEAGCFTSGGTESILLAMRAYKKIAEQRGVKGSILLAKSAHAAYWKAAEYFGMEIIEIETNYLPLDDIHVENNITKDTIVVIASAPTFNFGIIDDIDSLSSFCFKHHIYLHLDMCLGGFLVPFLDNMDINFTKIGVSSISMDTHKYGYGPKGGSVLLYSDPYLFKKHCFIKEDWTGGIYGTSNLTGSRSGAVIAATWAVMMACGTEWYSKEAKRIQNIVLNLRDGIINNPHLDVMGDPDVCIVAISSSYFNIYLLADMLKDKGWALNQLQNPPAFHFCVTSIHTMNFINDLLKDINECTINIINSDNKNKPKETVSIYGTTQKVYDREVITDVVRDYIVCLNELN
jgi:sphinganine-1-phosphate aldolase